MDCILRKVAVTGVINKEIHIAPGRGNPSAYVTRAQIRCTTWTRSKWLRIRWLYWPLYMTNKDSKLGSKYYLCVEAHPRVFANCLAQWFDDRSQARQMEKEKFLFVFKTV
jgi:hypothetical protein